MRLSTILGVVYIIVGVLVAATYNYLDHLGSLRGIISAVLAIILWPAVLLGVDLDIRRGR
jgi:hypothetical protein